MQAKLPVPLELPFLHLINAQRNANTKKAPGAIVKIETGVYLPSKNLLLKSKPNTVQQPAISLKILIRVSPAVKPSPMPIPSNTDNKTAWSLA